MSSKPENNDLQAIRTKLRRNTFFHLDYDPGLENTEAQKYFDGVYVMNKQEDSEDDEYDGNNFMEYILKLGNYEK